MCLSQAQNAAPIQPPPMSLPGAAAPDPTGIVPGGDTGPNSLGAALDASKTPQAAQVQTPTKAGRVLELATGGMYDPTHGVDTGSAPTSPNGGYTPTKFGALLKLIQPMMQGATIGGFLGRSNPGGGFGAAQNLFMQHRLIQMQQNQFTLQLAKMQSEVAKNQAEAAHAAKQGALSRVGQPQFVQDYQGQGPGMLTQDVDGNTNFTPGVTPAEKNSPVVKDTDQGEMSIDARNATATPITILNKRPGASSVPQTLSPQVGNAAAAKNNPAEGSDESASEPSARAAGSGVPVSFGNKKPSAYDSGSPNLPARGAASTAPSASPGAIQSSGNGIPQQLHAPGYSTPKPTVRASRNAAGVETDNIFDTNPNSPTFGQRIAATGNTRQPVPDRVGNRENSRDSQKASDVARSEQYAAAALEKNGGDPDKAIQSLNGLKIADPDAAKDFNRLLPQIRKSITDRAKQRKPKAKPTNSLGIPDADWQKMTGGQPAPDSNDEE
jgi:hypothetical protein